MKMKCMILAMILVVQFFLFDTGFSKPDRIRYAEDFYHLYSHTMYETEFNNLDSNILYLHYALVAPFDNPVRAMCQIKTREEHDKYKMLFRMHCNLLLVKNFIRLGWRFDKENVYYYNLEWRKSLKESFGIARYNYQQAYHYWNETQRYAALAREYNFRLNLDKWEDEAWEISEGQIDYKRVIDDKIADVDKKLTLVQ